MSFSLDGPLQKIASLSNANAEITAFDPVNAHLFAVSGNNTFQIIDLTDLSAPNLDKTIDLSGFGDSANSIAVQDGVVAIAVEAKDGNESGLVVFYDTLGNFLSDVQVGVLPDMLTFTPDGSKVLVANEGEPTDEGDPLGSISIIDLSKGASLLTQGDVITQDFRTFDGREVEFRAKGVRIFPDKSISEDLEPEYISVSPDGTTAWVTLQENNAVAVLNLETNEIEDLLPLGVQNHKAGQPTLETFELTDLPTLGTTIGGQEILLGGLSGLFYEGKDPETGRLKFVTVPDRGPNGEPTDVDGDGENERPFALPDYQAQIIRFELDPTTGNINLQDPIFLTRDDGAKPITGLPNIAGVDEEPVDLNGNPLPLDPFGADMEGIVVANDGSFWTVDEYRPAIYHFDPSGDLIERFVPEGTAALAGGQPGDFGLETLPTEYVNRRPNRGFEAIAYNPDANTIYAFIQTPLANPDRDTSDQSDVIRILGIDTRTGTAKEEYVYLLEDSDVRPGGRVDKIGDAVYDAETGKFFVIERDSAVGPNAKKAIFEIDLTGATNLLESSNSKLVRFLDTTDLTYEKLSADNLDFLGIQAVNKIKVTNLPSIGYDVGDKPEGLALLDDGRLAVINDNDFGLLDEDIPVDGTVPLNPAPTPVVLGIIDLGENNGLDASDKDDLININNQPLYGLRMPDAIASFEANGETYFITANEGDARNEDERVKDLVLDPEAFPNAATLQQDENLGRIQVSTIDGDLDNDGDFDQLFSYGSRSFTIYDSVGNIVFDSGDQLEQILADLTPDLFNANFEDDDLSAPPLTEEFADNSNLFEVDGRSDNKGPEPESVIVQSIGNKTFAFIGLERAGGGVVIYDVSNPSAPEFIQYSRSEGDVAPEGLTFIPASESPNGRHTLIISNEVSNTIGVFDFVPPELPIYDIQGANHQSGYVGEEVTTIGIVTAVDFNGFYLQDQKGDGNTSTSDGLFVFTGSTPIVEIGDEIKTTGEVSEFIPGGAETGNLSMTQLLQSEVEILSHNNPLPQAILIGDTGVLPPSETVISADELPINLQVDAANFNPETDAIDFFETIEGMRVTVEDSVTIAPTRVFNRFSGEAFVLPNQGAGVTPEDRLTARGTLNLNSGPENTGDQNPEKVQLQFNPNLLPDGFGIPELTVGDQLGDVTGIVGYSFGNYEVNVTDFDDALDFDMSSPVIEASILEPESTELIATENQLTVASYNVLNLDPNDDDGSADVANGQFNRLAAQIVNNLKTPDILALQEIQDNSGSTDDGTLDADVTLQTLVDAIADAGGPTYAFATLNPLSDGAFGGQPGGNIRNAFLYNPERVELDDASLALLTPDVLKDAGALTPEAFNGSRAPLAASFEFKGNTVQVVNNHFSSRFGSTPVFGGPQPFVQAGEEQRENQAQAINDYVDSVIAKDANAKVIVAGDLNTFEFTNDIAEILVGDDDVLSNLVSQAQDSDDAYTFIFDGNAQVLDHILVTDALKESAEFDVVHVNNDFTRDDTLAVFDETVASDHEPIISRFTVEPQTQAIFTLQILHASDLEGGVDAIDRAPNFAAITDTLEETYENTVILSAGDNFLPGPFLGAASDEALREPLQAFYQELFGEVGLNNIREGGGRVDISIMNAIGFDATAIGNHEFDLGSDFFESVIEADIRGGTLGDIRWLGAQFPYLSGNFNFSGDADLGDLFTDEILPNTVFQLDPKTAIASTDFPKIAPSTLIEQGGELIGVIGATTQILETISSPTGTTSTAGLINDMNALATVLQPQIDTLIAAGTNKVILVSHLQQIALEEELISLLNGVDVVIAGGSDTVLANDDDTLRTGDTAANTYPIVTTNADGDPAVIVSTNGEYSYVGQLVIDFNVDGILVDANGDPLKAIANLNLANNGPIATTDEGVLEITGAATLEEAIASSTKATQVKSLTDAVEGVVIAQDGNVFGLTNVFLDGSRESVRTEETNFGNLTADANLAAAKVVDTSVVVSLKNGGGIRAPIGEVDVDGNLLPPQENPLSGKEEGQISELDITNSLRFNNGLTLLTLTAAQLKQVLEHGVAASDSGATPGQFPQVGGLSFSFDTTQTAIAFSRDADGAVTGVETDGARVRSLAILNDDGQIIDTVVQDGVLVGDPNREIRVVTLDFLAGGGDSYPFPEFGINQVDLVDETASLTGAATFAADGSEQDALAEFLSQNFPADDDALTPSFAASETTPGEDLRIQNLAERADTVLDRDIFQPNMTPEADNDGYILSLQDLPLSVNASEGVLNGDSDGEADPLTAVLESSTQNGTLNFNDDGSFIYRPNPGFLGTDSFTYTAFDGTDSSSLAMATITVQLLPETPDDAIQGSDESELITGTKESDFLVGLGGNDRIEGRLGDDSINGGSGKDSLTGKKGNDLLDGGADDDHLKGGSGDDVLVGGIGNDVLKAQRGDDWLLGGDGRDTLKGNSGNDTLFGGNGDDELRGGGGSDLFVLSPNSGIDRIYDFKLKRDTIGLSGGITLGALAFETSGQNTKISFEDELIAIVKVRGTGALASVSNFTDL